MVPDQKILIAINQLKNWALLHHAHPKGTSFHAAALLHRGCILMNPMRENLVLAAVNSKEMCAERMLLRLCKERHRVKET
jgi:hypothetical protein